MTARVLRGYNTIPSAPRCPSCGDRHYDLVDDGNPDTIRVDCWCGAHARCRRDDPDLVAILGADAP